MCSVENVKWKSEIESRRNVFLRCDDLAAPVDWLDHTHTINQFQFYLFMVLCNFLSIFVPNIIKVHTLYRCANSTTVTGPQCTNWSTRKKEAHKWRTRFSTHRKKRNHLLFPFTSIGLHQTSFSAQYRNCVEIKKNAIQVKKNIPTFEATKLTWKKTFRILTMKNVQFQVKFYFIDFSALQFFFSFFLSFWGVFFVRSFCVNVKWKKIAFNWSLVYNGTN